MQCSVHYLPDRGWRSALASVVTDVRGRRSPGRNWIANSTPATFAGARTSHCSACVAGSNHSRETLPVQPVGAWISSREPVAVSTRLSPLVFGTFTSVIEPLAACLKICSTAHGPAACTYSPLASCHASTSPRSPLLKLRG